MDSEISMLALMLGFHVMPTSPNSMISGHNTDADECYIVTYDPENEKYSIMVPMAQNRGIDETTYGLIYNEVTKEVVLEYLREEYEQ